MMLGMYFEEGDSAGLGVGAIPILIGVALVISYVVEKKERDKEKNNS